MPSLRSHIHKAVFYNTQNHSRMVPKEVVVANCSVQGYEEAAVEAELDALVEEGELLELQDHYARPTDPDVGGLHLQTHEGDESMPWQFELERRPGEIVVRQARGPPEKFDPVEKRFAVESRAVGDEPAEFHHSVSRRVWPEDPSNPEVRSQRSQGHVVEFLYRDPEGRHLCRPDPADGELGTDGEFAPTELPGVRVDATFLRSEDGQELKFTEDRTYRVTRELLNHAVEVFVLAYDELNEESTEQALWEVEDAVAYELEPT